jgi:hypothetical protein
MHKRIHLQYEHTRVGMGWGVEVCSGWWVVGCGCEGVRERSDAEGWGAVV